MLKIILAGANGKMGQVITRLVSDMDDACIVAGVDINDSVANDYPVYSDIFDINEQADVIVDFSHPMCLESILKYARKNKMPAVIATTGLGENHK